MNFALVIDNAIVPNTERGRLPDSARRLDTGEWVLGLPTAPVAVQRSTGWFEVADTARPADTATHTHDRSLTLVDDVPTVTWVQRAWTAAELTARERPGKIGTLATRARNYLATIATRKTQIGTDQANATLTAHMALAALASNATLTVAVARIQQIDLTLKQLIPLVNRILTAENMTHTFERDQIHLDGQLIAELRDLLDGTVPPA